MVASIKESKLLLGFKARFRGLAKTAVNQSQSQQGVVKSLRQISVEQYKQLVKNTSAGFQLFYKSHVHQSDSESFCKELLELFRAGKVSPWDVFPDGLTWIEVCSGTSKFREILPLTWFREF
jgi:hypothetical protein